MRKEVMYHVRKIAKNVGKTNAFYCVFWNSNTDIWE